MLMQLTHRQAVELFCEQANWAYECWVTHKKLFDENSDSEKTLSKAIYFFCRLSVITQEYSILQICKLHDPASSGGKCNISILYMIEKFGPDLPELKKIKEKMDAFYCIVKNPRNKLLAHNDGRSLALGESMGAFEEGLDEEYFDNLKKFADLVSRKYLSTPFVYNDLSVADVCEFLEVLRNKK